MRFLKIFVAVVIFLAPTSDIIVAQWLSGVTATLLSYVALARIIAATIAVVVVAGIALVMVPVIVAILLVAVALVRGGEMAETAVAFFTIALFELLPVQAFSFGFLGCLVFVEVRDRRRSRESWSARFFGGGALQRRADRQNNYDSQAQSLKKRKITSHIV